MLRFQFNFIGTECFINAICVAVLEDDSREVEQLSEMPYLHRLLLVFACSVSQ